MVVECCFCGDSIEAKEAHSPYPAQLDGLCCAKCNVSIVVPTRARLAENVKILKRLEEFTEDIDDEQDKT